MHKVLVKFADSSKNCVTDINEKCTPEEICEYFLGKQFNLGCEDHEDMHTCIGIQINDLEEHTYSLNRFVLTLEDGGTFMMETAKPYADFCYAYMRREFTNKRTQVKSRVVKIENA